MARLNRTIARTHGGAVAVATLTPEQQLRRAVMSCLLWEDSFYESGKGIADRIAELATQVTPEVLASVAIEAREIHNLRHVPLLLLDTLSAVGRGNPIVSYAVERVIKRPDEMGELLSIYWRNGRKMLPHQVRKGLALALKNFDEYQFAKYDRDGAVKLRDVLRLARPKPDNRAQSQLFARVNQRSLKTPDTWEVELSAGKDKKATFERLIRDGKLGYLALLRNLRNMEKAGVDHDLVARAIVERKGGAQRVFPFRYIAAARAAPAYEPQLDIAFQAAIGEMPKLPGKTIGIIDVSGSMLGKLSAKSDMDRLDAAAALAAILRGMCEDPRIYATAGNDGTRVHKTALVPARHGMALVDAMDKTAAGLGGGGIFLTQAIEYVRDREKKADRIIVLTDEQDCDISAAGKPELAQPFGEKNYLLNVAAEKNGIGYGPKWTHIDGFSEGVVRFINELEQFNARG